MATTSLTAPAAMQRSGALAGDAQWRSQARNALRDKRIRFVLAGGVNTGFGFGCFVVYQDLVGVRWGYMLTLLLAHCTSVLFAFVVHRSVVFRVSGSLLRDLWRFESVYLVTLSLNAVLLPLLVEVGGLPVIIAQAAITAANVVVSWLGHSRFSFRRPAEQS